MISVLCHLVCLHFLLCSETSEPLTQVTEVEELAAATVKAFDETSNGAAAAVSVGSQR
jgi:hypothetical protein